MFDFYNTHFLIAGLAELSKGISLFTSVCAKFACVFLMGLFGVAFGLFVVPRFGVGYRNSGLNGRCRFDCREGHRWHEGRERQNGNEFLHKLKGLNTAQLGLSTFPGIGRMLTSAPLWLRASPGARRDEGRLRAAGRKAPRCATRPPSRRASVVSPKSAGFGCAQIGLWQGARRAHPPKWGCNRRATQPQPNFSATPQGGSSFSRSLPCSLLTDISGYVRRSRLVCVKNFLLRKLTNSGHTTLARACCKSPFCSRSADAYIRELFENPWHVRADVGIRAPILPLSQQPLARLEATAHHHDRIAFRCKLNALAM